MALFKLKIQFYENNEIFIQLPDLLGYIKVYALSPSNLTHKISFPFDKNYPRYFISNFKIFF